MPRPVPSVLKIQGGMIGVMETVNGNGLGAIERSHRIALVADALV